MAKQGFLYDNEQRAYPLLSDRPATMLRSDDVELVLPDATIVDFGCVVGLGTGWRPAADSVYVHQVRRVGLDTIEIELRTTCPGLAGYALVFSRDIIAPSEIVTEHVGASEVGAGSDGGVEATCNDPLIWEGFLTTGRLVPVVQQLSQGQSMTGSETTTPLETSLVQDLSETYVRSLNLANVNRTHTTSPVGCDPVPDGTHAEGEVIVAAGCLVGDIRLLEGYNCAIRVDRNDNSVTISAAVGTGAGEPCGEVPLFPGEEPPDGSTLLTGGPACDELVSSVNGLASPVLRFIAGTGVTIVPSADDPHTLVVTFDLAGLIACPEFVDSSH